MFLMLAVVCILSMVAVACEPSAEVPGDGEKVVKVGLHLVNTGPVAANTEPFGRGQLDYLRYVNEELGGINYKDPVTGVTEFVKIDVNWSDNALSIPRVISDYERLKALGVMAMTVFPGSSAASIGKKATSEEMPLFGVGAASYSGGLYPPSYFISSNMNVVEQAGIMLKWYKDKWTESRSPRIAVILMESPMHRPCEGPLPLYIEQLDMDFIGFEWLPLMVLDASVELIRIMSNNPDAIVINHTAASGAAMFKDLVRLGYKGQADIIVAHSVTEEKLTPELAGEACEGVYSFRFSSLLHEDFPGVNLAEDLSQRYSERDLSAGYLVAFGHTMVFVEGIKLALEEVGYENMDGHAIYDGILQVKDFDTGGIFPPITIDPEWPVVSREAKFLEIEKGGHFKSISDWVKTPTLRDWMGAK